LAKNWLTLRNLNFYFSTQLLFSARHYKFGDINNNELLIMNLAAVRAGRISNTSSSPSRERCMQASRNTIIFFATAIAFLTNCNDKNHVDKKVPNYIAKIITYFDSNRIKEFDSVSFEKKINWGNNYWRICDTQSVCYEYQVGFPSRVDNDYKFPVSDSLERIWVSDSNLFNRVFPMSKSLPPNKNVDLILNKNGTVDGKISWMNNDYDEKKDVIFNSIKSEVLFQKENPFTYFETRTKTMDSLGIQSILQQRFGNHILIELKPQQEYLYYLPNNLFIRKESKHFFDSLMTTGLRIDKNWVWVKFKKI
jgi:hypothetical protein